VHSPAACFYLRGSYAKLECPVSFSGTIVKVGTDITRFKLGDRVVTNSCGTIRNDARFGAYQKYALTTQELTAKVR
jgi:NADPH:quinone reductase-like Zn-dependent oxidoreductase